MKQDRHRLREQESEEETSFPPAERKISTQSYDLSIKTLVEQWDSDILLLPDIQREYVWDDGRASRLIESLLLNIPIPVLYFSETEDARFEIIDGHQRVFSVVRFIKNEFALSSLNILGEYKKLRYHQLPEKEQRFLLMRIIRAVIISNESHPNMKFEVFERLNTGSVSLNAQELRNSMYRGPFNDLLHSLAQDARFRKLIGTPKPRRRMADEELILRFFALRSRYDDYQPPIKKFLNDYMRSVRYSDTEETELAKGIFDKAVDNIGLLLGEKAFRLLDRQGEVIDGFVNRALFDSQMTVFSWLTGGNLSDKRTEALEALAEQFANDTFLDSIQRATSDRERTQTRVRGIARALEVVGLSFNPPHDL